LIKINCRHINNATIEQKKNINLNLRNFSFNKKKQKITHPKTVIVVVILFSAIKKLIIKDKKDINSKPNITVVDSSIIKLSLFIVGLYNVVPNINVIMTDKKEKK